MKVVKIIPLVVMMLLSGCGGGTSSSSSNKILFNNVSNYDTFTDENDVYQESGHYSLVFQANISGEEPLPGLEKAGFTIYEEEYEVAESKIYNYKDPKTVTNSILLLLDFSGSVVDSCEGITDANHNPYLLDEDNLCNKLVTSAKLFIDTVVDANQKLAVYYFNSRSQVFPLVTSTTASATDDKTALKSGVEQLFSQTFREEHLQGYESTNLYGAVVEATKITCQWVSNCNYDNYTPEIKTDADIYNFASVVIFTDGRELARRVTEKEMLSFIDKHKDNYYYTIGLGDADHTILEKIGKDGYFKAAENATLDVHFSELGTRINNWANSFYKIDYCPVQQEGTTTIKLKVEDAERGYYGTIEQKITLPANSDWRCDL